MEPAKDIPAPDELWDFAEEQTPWPQRSFDPVRVIDARDGWVRYAIDPHFPDERMPLRSFVRLFRRRITEAESGSPERPKETEYYTVIYRVVGDKALLLLGICVVGLRVILSRLTDWRADRLDYVIDDVIQAGCNATDIHLRCTYPDCKCKHIPAAVTAALAATATPKTVRNVER